MQQFLTVRLTLDCDYIAADDPQKSTYKESSGIKSGQAQRMTISLTYEYD